MLKLIDHILQNIECKTNPSKITQIKICYLVFVDQSNRIHILCYYVIQVMEKSMGDDTINK